MQNRWTTLIGTGIFSAGIMYYFDPDRGRRRRRLLNNQVAQAGHSVQSGISKTMRRDIRNRTWANRTWNRTTDAAAASMRKNFGFRASDGAALAKAKKVQARLGNWVNHPASINFIAHNKRSMRNRWITLATSTGILSAGLIYFLDPKNGTRRWSLMKDRFTRASHSFQSGFGKTRRDIGNRTSGALASIRSRFGGQKPGNDEVLAQRVRSHLGRIVSHPGSIDVTAQNGRVTLSGLVLAPEVGQLIWHVYSVRGVNEVENRLDVHDEPGRIPGLQGEGSSRQGKQSLFRRTSWSPAMRAVAGVAGASAFAYGVSRRGPFHNRWAGIASAVAGSLLTTRAVTNLEVSRLTGIGARRRAIDVHKTTHINAPVQQVFSLWADFENFPRFMSHVRQVRRLENEGKGRHWRWTVDGPAGTKVEFDVTITAFKENRLIAWGTDRSSLIQHIGRAEFFDEGDGSTTVKVRMSYNPIAGALGHAVAKFFGADPKNQMDDDLLRLKSYIETGKQPHDAKQQAGGKQAATPSRPH